MAAVDGVPRPSYCVNILYRIEMMQRVMRDMQSLVNKMRRRLQNCLTETEERNQLMNEIDLLQMRVRFLKEEVTKTSKKLNFLKHEKLGLENDIHESGVDMSSRFQRLKREKELLNERKRKLDEEREKLLKTNAQLLIRKKQLITEVVNIYRISPSTNEKESFSICDVPLPNSEDFSGRDYRKISVALGYVCHCLLIISKFLDVPLRYSIIYCGSKSVVVDHINQRITDSERVFPTFTESSGKGKVHFDYGVYLVNRNIAQIRQNIGLKTTDLRKTLPNLYSLLEERLTLSNGDNVCSDSNLWPKVDSCLQRELELMSKSQNLSYSLLSTGVAADKSISVSLDKGLNELTLTDSQSVDQKHRRKIALDYPVVSKTTNAPVYNYSEPHLARIEKSNGHSVSAPENVPEWVVQQDYCESVSSNESSKPVSRLTSQRNNLIIIPSPSGSTSS